MNYFNYGRVIHDPTHLRLQFGSCHNPPDSPSSSPFSPSPSLPLSRRWKAQDAKTEVLARGAAAGTLYGGGFAVNVQNKGMANTGPAGQYGVTLEDRMRWAHIAETLTNQNIYAVSRGRERRGRRRCLLWL